jgi:hypothetical protein
MVRIETPGYFVVCEYYPPGNVEGDNNQFFKDNVHRQVKGKPTDTEETGVTGAACSLRAGNDGASKYFPEPVLDTPLTNV